MQLSAQVPTPESYSAIFTVCSCRCRDYSVAALTCSVGLSVLLNHHLMFLNVQANCSCIIPAQASPLIFTNSLGFYKMNFTFSSCCWKLVEHMWSEHVDDTLKFIFLCDLLYWNTTCWNEKLMHGWTSNKFSVMLKCIILRFSWALFKGRFQKSMTLWQCNFPFATVNLWLNCVAFICCSCFSWYFTPRFFEERGLGTEAAVYKDKSLEEKPENMAELLTQDCLLRLTDLLVISAKASLTCKANTLLCCHHPFFTQL